MKIPLRYQISEYDCGPTSMLNAVSFLFQREEIYPEIVRNIMLYCLDCFGSDGVLGKSGTSPMAMMFLSNWLNGVGQAGHLPVSSRHLSGEAVNLRQNSLLRDALRRGGAVVVLVDFDGGHYVLLTGIQDDQVYLFDPYYREIPFEGEDIQMVTDHPMAYNRVAPVRYFEREERGVYSMGPVEEREAVLLFNQRTKLTEEKTVEYII
jgi:hypothetical protein